MDLMNMQSILNHYFNGFSEIYHFRDNSLLINALVIVKIFSYFTVVVPLAMGTARACTYLYNRVYPRSAPLSPEELATAEVATQNKVLADLTKLRVNSLLAYTGDLTEEEKTTIHYAYNPDKTVLSVKLKEGFNVTIRRQDLFESGAQVTVNAANTHLGGGGGIDGATHKEGGVDYQNAHKLLRGEYGASFTQGFAAMISSGALAKKGIENVIVVAGPSGTNPTAEQKNALYSCYYNALFLAHNQKKRSIAFPSISTGIYHFPREEAAKISLKAVKDFVDDHSDSQLRTISIHFLLRPLGKNPVNGPAEGCALAQKKTETEWTAENEKSYAENTLGSYEKALQPI